MTDGPPTRGAGDRLKDTLVYAGYAAGWAAIRRMPERLARSGFERVADQVWRRRGRGVVQLERNLHRVRPDADDIELRALSRTGIRSYFRYWCEAFRLPDLAPAEITARCVIHNGPQFWAAVESGRGVVAALPHLGNWDLAGAWVSASGAPLTTVAERLRPERLFDRFVGYREALGMEVLPLTGGPDPTGILAERLRAGRLVCLVADRDLSARGVEVKFFGETAKMPAGPAALAVRTGADLIPASLWYDGPRMHIRFHDPLEKPTGSRQAIRDMTQALADVFAAAIAEHPEDWHMLQRLWVADLR